MSQTHRTHRLVWFAWVAFRKKIFVSLNQILLPNLFFVLFFFAECWREEIQVTWWEKVSGACDCCQCFIVLCSSSLLCVLNALNLNNAIFFFVRVCSVSYFVIVCYIYTFHLILSSLILKHYLGNVKPVCSLAPQYYSTLNAKRPQRSWTQPNQTCPPPSESLSCTTLAGPRWGTKRQTGLAQTRVSHQPCIFFFFIFFIILMDCLIDWLFLRFFFFSVPPAVDPVCMESTACRTCARRSRWLWSATWSVVVLFFYKP